MRRYSSESECRMGIAKYEDYPSKVPYNLKDGVMVGDVCPSNYPGRARAAAALIRISSMKALAPSAA
jgi:hypothetical protein